jgi:hypothetical protein
LLPCFLGLITCARAAEPTLAFPGAEGAGRFASGGRTGQVVHVTNLNASGPGSLAEAVSGPDRIVVFDVSGIIDLTHEKDGVPKKGGVVRIEYPNLTIAGQSAPGEGICLKGGALSIAASNVIVRHLRVRRGFIAESDSGDALELKPPKVGEQEQAVGRDQAVFEKIKIKKIQRGKTMHAFSEITDVMLDHLSTSWATDENLTLTHAERTTAQFCVAAEGLDYANPKQTPPNHSEGSLWGSGTPDGRSTLHHSLYAHNRLRNPRTTGGADEPAVLTFYNNIVYDWSEYPSHTGSERVLVNWLNNTYRPGPSTPAEMRGTMFIFMGDPGARIFARGNAIVGDEAATEDNRRAIAFNRKLEKLSSADRAGMIVDATHGEPPESLEGTRVAYARVLAEAGATLPARDSVDARILRQVRDGTGKVIEKETNLAPRDRWPNYRSLPPPPDRDRDGMPDFWEEQFGLNPDDPADAMRIAAGGYANIEHYLNSTNPTGRDEPVVFVSAIQSRASAASSGRWQITRTGSTARELRVAFRLEGDAESGRDFRPIAQEVAIPAGAQSVEIELRPVSSAAERIAVLRLSTQRNYAVGCPSAALIVTER